MVDILNNFYQVYFKNDKDMVNNFSLIENYLKRYHYKIAGQNLSEGKIYIRLIMANDDARYNAVYGLMELSKDEIYLEVDKELFSGSCCVCEHLTVNKYGFEGNMCDFAFFNANVVLIENNHKEEHLGKICETKFTELGIKDENDITIPYENEGLANCIDEVLEIHDLNKTEIAETFDFDDYIVKSLVVNNSEPSDINFYNSLNISFKQRRGRRR